MRPDLDPRVYDQELLLLADAQNSSGLLIAAELPRGELMAQRSAAAQLTVR
jgi:hypothetical protein